MLVGARAALVGTIPIASNSSLIQPAPTPRMKRPSLKTSSAAASAASVDRVAVGQHEHARAEPDALGHARDHARASRAGRATACRASSRSRCRSAGTDTGSRARRASRRGARPRPSRSRAARPPGDRQQHAPCRGRARRSGARLRCARRNPNAAGGPAEEPLAGEPQERPGRRIVRYCGYLAPSAATARRRRRRPARPPGRAPAPRRAVPVVLVAVHGQRRLGPARRNRPARALGQAALRLVVDGAPERAAHGART